MSDVRIYEGEDEVMKMLLNKYELEDFTTGTRLAFVDSVTESTTKTQKPFFKFNLRDSNGMIVVARLFNFEESEETVNILRKLNRNVVKVTYLVTDFNGEPNLNLDAIDLVPEQMKEIEKYFLGTVDGLDDIPNKILSEVSKNMPVDSPKYKYVETFKQANLLHKIKSRALEAYSWKLGSGIQHIYNTLMAIEGTPLTAEDKEDARLIYMIAETFVNNERELDDTDLGEGFLNNLKVLEALVNGVSQKDEQHLTYHKRIKKEVMHLVQVRLGMAEPQTLTAHVVQLADNLTRTSAMLSIQNNALRINTTKNTPKGKLVKL